MVDPTQAPIILAKTEPRGGTLPWGTPLLITDYGAALKKSGIAVLPGVPGTIWTQYETAAMVRLPDFHTAPVSRHDARQVLRRSHTAVISFIVEPDAEHRPNAWLYLCRDQSYALNKLANEVKRHVRRAQGALRIGPIDWKTLLENGLMAYSDTRARVGLSDGSITNFRQRFEAFSSVPGHYVAGAWKGESLVAFMTLMVIDDWVAIEGSFSVSAELDQRPNNGLAHYVLDNFLVKQGFKTVCYGSSSIQESSQKSGLHAYKTRIGFEAKPVHRAFIVHPILRPLVNKITLWSLRTALRFNPADRRLLKAIGVVNYILSSHRIAGKDRDNGV